MDNLRTETPQQAGHRLLKTAGYASGGAVAHEDEAEDKALIKKELSKARIKVKAGGKVSGRKPPSRPDRAHRARGGEIPLNGVATVDRRYEAEGIDQPHGPENKRAHGGGVSMNLGKPPEVLDGGGSARSGRPEMPPQDYERVPHRAAGGRMSDMPRPHMAGHGGKGRGPKVVNVIVGKGDDDGKAQMAHQAGMQQGMQMGADAAAQKIAGGAGPPRPPMMPPGAGGPPPGAMPPGGAPMARPPMPPPQMAAKGGVIKVRAHHRRVGGAV